jgi:hypothetical protein
VCIIAAEVVTQQATEVARAAVTVAEATAAATTALRDQDVMIESVHDDGALTGTAASHHHWCYAVAVITTTAHRHRSSSASSRSSVGAHHG